METVIVDANCIVRRDWRLTTSPWRVLAYRSRQRMCSLVVPELVVREAVGRYRHEVAAASERAQSAAADLSKLGIEISTRAIDIDAEAALYEEQLRRSIEDAGGVVAQPPAVDVLDLVDRAIARRRPFDQKGGGFRDALLWEHVLATLTTAGSETVLLSADRAAFSEGQTPGVLAASLSEEVRARGYSQRIEPNAVALFESISDYLKSVGVDDPTLTVEINDLVETEYAQLSENIKAGLEGLRVDPDRGLDLIQVERAHDPVQIVVLETFKQSPEDGPVFVALEVEAGADIHIEFWGTRWDTLNTTTTLHFDCTATYDLDSRTLDNITFDAIVVDVEGIVEPRPRPMPYDEPLPW